MKKDIAAHLLHTTGLGALDHLTVWAVRITGEVEAEVFVVREIGDDAETFRVGLTDGSPKRPVTVGVREGERMEARAVRAAAVFAGDL